MKRGVPKAGLSSPGRRALLVPLAACVVFAALIAIGDAEVVAEGRLLSWRDAHVRQVEALGVRFYLDEEFWPRIDVLTTWVLAAIGAINGFAAILVGRGGDARVRRFLILASAGAWWLCVDEGLGLHETIGNNLGFVADLPGIRNPDDVIPALYVGAAFAFGIAFLPLLRSSRDALRLFAAAVAVAVGAALVDLTDSLPDRLEDAIEVLAGLLVLAGATTLARDLVRAELSHTGA